MKKIYLKLLMTTLLALGIKSINAQCTANFSMTINSGGNVTFTSTSTGTSSNTIYNWSFGDGNNYSVQNNIFATNTYSANGTYSVYLFIYDTLAMSTCSAGIQYTLAITSATCGGNASFGQTFGPGGLTNFNSTSTGVSTSSTYYWDFGDGNTTNSGTNTFVSHTYTASAVYPVTLIISDPLTSCTYSTVQNVSVTVASCSLVANFTYTLGANGLVNFASTSTGTSANTGYSWDFGDGYNGSGPTTSHTYSTNAAYTVTLSLVDSTASFYCYDHIALTFSVSSVPCVANSNFTIAKDSSMLYTWKAFPNYPSNIVAANWSWGDATSTNGLYPSHTYSAAGVYNICLTVTVNCLSGPLTSSTCVSSNIYRITGSTASMITINVINSSLGIQSVIKDQASYSIYPNPNNGHVNLQITNTDLKEIDVAVYNVMGEKVYNSVFTPVNGSVASNIDLNYLPNGTYFVKLGYQGETKKLVILR